MSQEFPAPEELISYYDFAIEVSRCGAEISGKFFRTSIDIETKADDSPVTIADRSSEAGMRDLIASKYPGHRIIGEEMADSGDSDSDWKWVLDPIDGTKSFIHGIPLYTTLVALLYKDQPVIGVINNPQLNELCSAGIGMGCWLNGEKTRVSTVEKLGDSRVLTTDPGELLRRHPEAGSALMQAGKINRTWADGYGYLLVASGRSEIMVDPVMSLWDIACLAPVITEAGGEFTDIQGNRDIGTSSVATNGLVHEEVMKIFGAPYHKH